MRATLVLRRREVLPGGLTVEMVIWQLPAPTAERPHGLKYRLQAHRHYGRREECYEFAGMARLIEDFVADVERLGDLHG